MIKLQFTILEKLPLVEEAPDVAPDEYEYDALPGSYPEKVLDVPWYPAYVPDVTTAGAVDDPPLCCWVVTIV